MRARVGFDRSGSAGRTVSHSHWSRDSLWEISLIGFPYLSFHCVARMFSRFDASRATIATERQSSPVAFNQSKEQLTHMAELRQRPCSDLLLYVDVQQLSPLRFR